MLPQTNAACARPASPLARLREDAGHQIIELLQAAEARLEARQQPLPLCLHEALRVHGVKGRKTAQHLPLRLLFTLGGGGDGHEGDALERPTLWRGRGGE